MKPESGFTPDKRNRTSRKVGTARRVSRFNPFYFRSSRRGARDCGKVAWALAPRTIRRAHEGWPLLCETPLEGGTTSRFVDTSIERLEFTASPAFAAACHIRVQGRALPLRRFPGGQAGAGLRYRRTALHPSLHPGIPPHLPLHLTITCGKKTTHYQLDHDQRHFTPAPDEPAPAPSPSPCKSLHARLITCDLRLP